jgi:hypothetical protein
MTSSTNLIRFWKLLQEVSIQNFLVKVCKNGNFNFCAFYDYYFNSSCSICYLFMYVSVLQQCCLATIFFSSFKYQFLCFCRRTVKVVHVHRDSSVYRVFGTFIVSIQENLFVQRYPDFKYIVWPIRGLIGRNSQIFVVHQKTTFENNSILNVNTCMLF